jgi:hypothetical protein
LLALLDLSDPSFRALDHLPSPEPFSYDSLSYFAFPLTAVISSSSRCLFARLVPGGELSLAQAHHNGPAEPTLAYNIALRWKTQGPTPSSDPSTQFRYFVYVTVPPIYGARFHYALEIAREAREALEASLIQPRAPRKSPIKIQWFASIWLTEPDGHHHETSSTHLVTFWQIS